MDTTSSHNSQDAPLPSGAEIVRMRPGMYIGDMGPRGLHRLVSPLLDNAVNEASAGHCSEITVTLHTADTLTVEDNGRGIPVTVPDGKDRSVLEIVLTELHGGCKYGTDGPTPTRSRFGGDLSYTNPLCASLVTEVHRDGYAYRMAFARGLPVTELECLGSSDKHGTAITITPDKDIFEPPACFLPEVISDDMQYLAYLNPGVTFRFVNEMTGDRRVFLYPRGIVEFVETHDFYRHPRHPVIYACIEGGPVRAEVALQYNMAPETTLVAFVNNELTLGGGTHVDGLYKGLIRAFTPSAQKHGLIKKKSADLTAEEVTTGMTAFLAIRMENPQYYLTWKGRLHNAEVEPVVETLVADAVAGWLKENRTPGVGIVLDFIQHRDDR